MVEEDSSEIMIISKRIVTFIFREGVLFPEDGDSRSPLNCGKVLLGLIPPSSGHVSSSLKIEQFGHPTACADVKAKREILPLPGMRHRSSNCLTVCDAMPSGSCFQICCRNMLPSTSTLKMENRPGWSRGIGLD
jgi:hypothetical protein